MSKIGKNIKKIRATKNLSQAAFAEIFGLTRASVGAYEEGRAEPKTDIILQIAKHFSIPIETLLSKELTVNQLSNFKIQTSKTDTPTKPVLFINNWNWNTFIEKQIVTDQFTVYFPNQFIKGDIAFEINTHIQSNFNVGDIIICEHNNSINIPGLYLFIAKDQAFISESSRIKKENISFDQAFLIKQKIETISPQTSSNLEDRIAQMEIQMEKLIQKLNK